MGKSEPDNNKGDRVMLKRNMVQDSLTTIYDGPFEILERSGSDVKLQLAAKDRWVHRDTVKKFLHVGQAPIVIGHMTRTRQRGYYRCDRSRAFILQSRRDASELYP